MLRTLVINSNKKCVKFWCFDSFLITKAIWDWGEFFGIHARSIPRQGVWIHHRIAFGQHSTRMSFHPNGAAPPPFYPNVSAAIPSGCISTAHFPPGWLTSGNMLTSRNLLRRHSIRMSHIRHIPSDILHPAPDAGWERRHFNFSRRTYPDQLIASTRMGE